MSDKRKRIYYTKAQITEGLVTNGGEWMFTDNTEYIGQYHTYTTGEVFSEASYVKDKSRILIPYINIDLINEQNEIGIDTTKNFEYDNIKNFDVTKSIIPNPSRQPISNNDIKSEYIIRYFAYKVNDGQLLELDKDTYNKVGSEDGLDKILWRKFQLRWKVSGPDNDIIKSDGSISEYGIIDTNKRTIALKSEEYPTLMDYIVDYKDYSI